MYTTGSMLFFGASIWLFLPNANASPLPATTTVTTTVHEFRITPLPIRTEPHTINFASLSSMFCQDNVRSKGCEPPASLTKKEEHSVPTSLCGGENCKITDGGGCMCHPIFIVPASLCGEHCKIINGECICPHSGPIWPMIRPDIGSGIEPDLPIHFPEIEGEPTPTPTPTPTEILAMGHRSILETRAVDGTEPHHSLSPRDNEGELLCHKIRGCNRWQGNLPPVEAEVISKRDTDHLTLPYRNDEAELTVTQTSTTTHSPKPTTLIGACDRRDVKCLNRHHSYHCDASKGKCFFDFLPYTASEERFPTPTAGAKECPENDRQCQGSFLQPSQLEEDRHKNPEKLCGVNGQLCQGNRHFPPTKAEKEEKRNVDVVLPTATGTSEGKPDVDCSGMPWLCV